jgi:hypothetical protein
LQSAGKAVAILNDSSSSSSSTWSVYYCDLECYCGSECCAEPVKRAVSALHAQLIDFTHGLSLVAIFFVMAIFGTTLKFLQGHGPSFASTYISFYTHLN